ASPCRRRIRVDTPSAMETAARLPRRVLLSSCPGRKPMWLADSAAELCPKGVPSPIAPTADKTCLPSTAPAAAPSSILSGNSASTAERRRDGPVHRCCLPFGGSHPVRHFRREAQGLLASRSRCPLVEACYRAGRCRRH